MTTYLKNVVTFPAFYPNFYGGVGIKPLGRVGIQVFSVMLLVLSSGFYHCSDVLVVNCEISFTVSLGYPAVLVLVLEPDRSQGQLSPGFLPHPGCFLSTQLVPLLLWCSGPSSACVSSHPIFLLGRLLCRELGNVRSKHDCVIAVFCIYTRWLHESCMAKS